MKQFSSTLALFVIGLLFVSIVLNVVFIPRAIRKPPVELQPYEKTVILNSSVNEPKFIVNQVIREGLTPISTDTAGNSVYTDTIRNQYVDIAFTNCVQGVLLSSKLDYTLKTPPLSVEPLLRTIKDRSGRLYGVGSLSTEPANPVSLGLIYVPGRSRLLLGYQYGICPGTHSIMLGYQF